MWSSEYGEIDDQRDFDELFLRRHVKSRQQVSLITALSRVKIFPTLWGACNAGT